MRSCLSRYRIWLSAQHHPAAAGRATGNARLQNGYALAIRAAGMPVLSAKW